MIIALSFAVLLWSTSGRLHKIDPSTVAILAVCIMLFPGVRVCSFEEISSKVSWGTLILLGAAISIGSAMQTTKAAEWLANKTIIALGISNMHLGLLVVIVGILLAIGSLAFSSRTAAVAAYLPIVIIFSKTLENYGVNPWGFSLVSYLPLQFSVLLPVNSPMATIAYTSKTFSSKELFSVGLPLTLLGIVYMAIYAVFYWRFLGIM